MKYVILLCDGMADNPIESLGGRTPMEAAHNPSMNWLAQTAQVGMVRTVPEGMTPGSDVANLAVLGYDPAEVYTGRSPLEAASMGIELAPRDMAMRCNLVTLSGDGSFEDKVMADYCAGDISTAEAAQLIAAVQEKLGGDGIEFHAGVSYRHCLVSRDGWKELGTFTPPHDISSKRIGEYLNSTPAAQPFIEMMRRSMEILERHPVNLARIERGERPANAIWFWGQGSRPALRDFTEKTGLKGSMVSAVDLLRGIARCAGMRVVEVEGATGYIDTNFYGKAVAAAEELKNGQDFVYVHVEAPDECGHRGEVETKVRAIEMIDQFLLKPLLAELEQYDDYRILILPDHPTPLYTRTHAGDPVPFLLYQKTHPCLGVPLFCEEEAKKTGVFIAPGHTLIERLILK